MSARTFAVGAVIWILILVSCSGPPPPPPRPTLSGEGCIMGSSAASLQSDGQVFLSSGYPTVDQFYQTEGLNLVYTYGVSPAGVFYDDSASPNAFATPEAIAQSKPDGTVVYGVNLLSRQLSMEPSGTTVIAIMAHEFGHVVQFRLGGITGPGKAVELHADYIAGWYLALRGQVAETNLASVLQTFYAIGDYAFNDPGHHGTPDERLAAATAGFSSYGQSAFDLYTAYQEGLGYVASLP
jgi:hypothetical protein